MKFSVDVVEEQLQFGIALERIFEFEGKRYCSDRHVNRLAALSWWTQYDERLKERLYFSHRARRWISEPIPFPYEKFPTLQIPRLLYGDFLIRTSSQDVPDDRLSFLGWLVGRPPCPYFAFPDWFSEELAAPHAIEDGFEAPLSVIALAHLRRCESVLSFLGWYLQGGRDELPDFRMPGWFVAACRRPSPRLPQAESAGISLGMHAIWSARSDLQAAYPLETADGRLGFLGWVLAHGPANDAFSFPDWFADRLDEPAPCAHADAIGISRAMLCIMLGQGWRIDASLQNQMWMLGAFLRQSGPNYRPAPWVFDRLFRPSPAWPDAEGSGVTTALHALWIAKDPELGGFSSPADAVEAFVARGPALAGQDLVPPWVRDVMMTKNPSQDEHIRPWRSIPPHERAVLVSGWFSGELGIGEDARMACLSLDLLAVRYGICDASRIVPVYCRTEADYDVRKEGLPDSHAVNLVYLAAKDFFLYRSFTPESLWSQKYTICSSPWELPKWPPRFNFIYDFIDEIWAPTRFVASAYAPFPKAITVVPLVVDVGNVSGNRRKQFGFTDAHFVFFYNFDSHSSYARKNPNAIVRAFQTAFPRAKSDVRLLIKTANAHNTPKEWEALNKAVRGDNRIQLINQTMKREDSLELTNSCDAFVSLHRSEGFGRNIAEAMLMKKPVIVSSYSGNLDYTTDDNAFLVGGTVRSLVEGEYLYPDGQEWFEPDIGHAAEQMLKVYEDRMLSKARAARGQETIAARYSPGPVSRVYHEQLSKILGL